MISIWHRRRAIFRWILIEVRRDRTFRFNALSLAGILAAPTVISIAISTGDFKIIYLLISLLAGIASWIWLMDSIQRRLRDNGHPKWTATFFASIAVAVIIFLMGIIISMLVPGLKFPLSIFGLYDYVKSIF